mmetsp:Transcript_11832/g.27086  ORF Transcript_11832/g.27086 Transcript_11832/m.27086 type:complete len:747 (+) Transcript_11832:402-2642(+)
MDEEKLQQDVEREDFSPVGNPGQQQREDDAVRNGGGGCLLASYKYLIAGAIGWILAVTFVGLYWKERRVSRDREVGEILPTPVILKLAKVSYPENAQYERMIIQGFFNGTNDNDNGDEAGILRWRNQNGFWYLEVLPVTYSRKDCPIPNDENLYGRLEPVGVGLNPTSKSSCNLYDFRLVIFNDLEEGATVHFHGLTPPSNEDGVPFVSNANIFPQNLQRYRFKAFTYPGFHWMHAHTGFQQAFGVAAPIVLQHSNLYCRANKFQREDDLIVMFEEGFIYPRCAYSGHWWYKHDCSGAGIDQTDFGKLAFFINRREEPIDHTPGRDVENIRIRFLNGGSEAPWRIDGTNISSDSAMEILATDGQDVVRDGKRKSTFILGLANRIDALIKVDPSRDLLITGIQMKHSGNVTHPALRHIVIRGRDTPSTERIDIAGLPKYGNFNSTILKNFDLIRDLSAAHPLRNRSVSRSYTVWNRGGDQYGGFPLTIFTGLLTPENLENYNSTPLHGPIQTYTQLNQRKFQLPPYKVYRNRETNVVISTRRTCENCTTTKSGIRKRPRGSYEIEYSDKNADGDDTCCWEWCDVKNCSGFELEDVETYKPNNNYIPVCFGDRVRILFINSASFEGSEGHPMHLHGHNFVLRELFNVSDDGQQLVYSAEYGKDQYNISGPRVDSIWVPFNQAVAFDFDAYNPGEHLFHCHNDFHLENGMTTTIRYMHDEYCRNSLPEFKGGKNNYPTQFCEMDNCSPP